MPVTGLRGRQILDGDVLRNDLNTTTSGSAVITKIIAGTNITISSTGVDAGTGDVTINASGGTGSVTSVGLTAPNIFGVTGSPITTSGTITMSLVNQLANTIWAGPTSGAEGTPTFRTLVAADIPALTLENLPDAWVKRAVRVATTANITLSGTQTIDGISVVAGDRVLVKNQTTTSQNGIYVVSAGAWSRSADANTSSEIAGGMVAVDLGTTNGGTTWDTDFRSSDTIGTTAMTWFRIIDTGYGQALTRTDDTNVTLTLGGTPSTALIQPVSLTLGWTGQLAVGRGGSGASTLTGVLIGNGTSAFTGVTGTASQLLRRNAGNTAYEFFSAGNLTRTDDTNVTLTLGGTPTGALINAVSLTLGWSGQLSVGRGGTGASTLTGVVIGNGTSAMTSVSGTASQLLRRNAGNTAYEFFTHDFASTSGATFTGQIISTRANNTGDGLGQIFLNGATGNRIDFNINGVAAPSLTTRSAGTKIVLYPAVSATLTDYAFGIEGDTLWSSVASASGQFKWYGATQLNMHLSGQNLLIGSGVGVGAGRLTVVGAAGGTSLYLTDAINSTLIISHPASGVTRFTNGASVLWLSETGGNTTLGNSTSSPSRLFVYNDNIGQGTISASTQSSLTSLQNTTPLQLNDLYNSGANGHNLIFRSTAALGVWEYNITKTFGGVLTLGSAGSSSNSITRHLYIYDSGQLRFANYTTTSSFTGTAVGVLAFTSDGSIITIATPGGGSGLTGTGTTNYIPKFTGSTSVGNSVIFDNGTDIGIGTATPSNIANYRTLQLVGGGSGSRIMFSDSTGTNRGVFYGSTAETAINAVGAYNLYVDNVNIANGTTTLFDVKKILRASNAGSQIQITGGGVEMGLYMSSVNNFLYITDWASGANGMVIDGGNGIVRLRSSSANGSYFQFERSTATAYGYIGNSFHLFTTTGFTANTDLGIRSEGAINFGTGATGLMRLLTTGQLRLASYTTTTSFTGTLVGYLAYDSSGNIICSTGSGGGSSQWTTNGTSIYYNTGNIGLGPTTPLQKIHILTANGTAAMVRFDQTDMRTYDIGILASTQSFTIRDVSASANRFQVLGTGQFVFNAYTSYNSFSATDAQGILGFDTSGNIISMYAPIYRHVFVGGAPVTANNIPSNISFFNSSNTYVSKMDLTGKKRARLHGRVSTAGTATSVLRVRYSTTFSTTASTYLTMGSSEIEIGLNTTGHFDSGWINLVAGAKADVFIALLTNGGDGAADPVLNQVVFETEE